MHASESPSPAVPVTFPDHPAGVAACVVDGTGELSALPLSQWEDQFLSAEEHGWIPAGKPNPARRLQWIMARVAGKSAVIELIRRQAVKVPLPGMTEISITNDKDGAPSVCLPGEAEEGACRFSVSLAHSGQSAAAAASAGPVGIDMEFLARVPKFGWDRIATAAEVELCRAAAGSGIPATPMLQLWTAKEAASKAARVGLGDGVARWRLNAIQQNRWWTIADQGTGVRYRIRFTVVEPWLLALACRDG